MGTRLSLKESEPPRDEATDWKVSVANRFGRDSGTSANCHLAAPVSD